MANRTGAIAGINGDYFEINGPGRPIAMVKIDGRLWQSPTYYAVLGITASGHITIGPESFSGRIIDGTANHALSSVNIYGDARRGGIVLITPALGAPISTQGDTLAFLRPTATLNKFIVQSISSNIPTLPALSNQYVLIEGRQVGSWLATNLHTGTPLQITEAIAPHNNLVSALGGGPMVIKNGVIYHDPNAPLPGQSAIRNPLTAVGVTRDGTHAIFIVFDGRKTGPWRSVGVTYNEAAQYMLIHNCYQAMLFDTGGSFELVARRSGRQSVSVINMPSDGHERPVANGLFIYSR